ncbi:Inner membrane metabolite transport protein yhjE [Brevundimonas diminuta]|jgi:MFS family permease|uniref:MFS transporter n=2 Tax=Brevundimonas TaxID=41275 RepID=A0A246KIP9_BREDI|nr:MULTISPECIES: MFS transporter [Brevundimonas]OJU53974.1 MAG: arabinose ABC transporter permease [Brevundimonas sp. 67-6]ASD25926.1 MFS transporter [Brevundimonas diminuta]EGF95185.1 sugar and other transporter family protein [Brevundimonas diminuta ATCC 11568]OMG58435.1 MFS transporter [Brevundimonas sp. ZS04]OWR22559.1 MFS transporter [Brevundimonas diminuta]
MNAASGAPSSEPLERDASRINARDGKIDAGEIAIGVIIGRTSEFFDFFVYAIASVVVFPQLVFPYAGPLGGTLLSFAVFAVAFIARPFGTALFIAVDRRFGRGTKLTIALFLLGLSTVCLGFLPGHAQVGHWSAAMLIALRIGQGVALGGAWDGMASLLAVAAPEKRRGWYAMVPQLGAPFGLIVASALFAYFLSKLSAADFMDWGWRYPFFVAFAINVVALFARLRIVVTPTFQAAFKTLELHPTPVTKAVREEGGSIVIGAFAPLASFAMFHMVTVFPLSWVFLYTDEAPSRFLMIELIGAVFGLIAIMASGWLADRYGRRALLAVTAAGIAAFSGFAPQLLDGGPAGELTYMILGFILLGLSFGQASGSIASSFSLTNRYTASALTSDLAWLFGAGFAPLAALALSGKFGLVAGGAYLLSGAICTLLALWLNRELAKGRAGAKA